MEATKRTVPETIAYFRYLSSRFEAMAGSVCDQAEQRRYYAKAEAYEIAAFELERNTEWCDKCSESR